MVNANRVVPDKKSRSAVVTVYLGPVYWMLGANGLLIQYTVYCNFNTPWQFLFDGHLYKLTGRLSAMVYSSNVLNNNSREVKIPVKSLYTVERN